MTSGRIRCGKVQPLLALAASQDLGERASRLVWSHLAECMACRRRYTTYLELRSALTELDPRRPGAARAAGVGGEFFGGLQRDILARIEQVPAASRSRRLWGGAVAAAALFLASALAIQAWLPHGAGLLHREPIDPVAPAPFVLDPGDSPFGTTVTPLSYPQGLGARRQIDLLFDEEAGFEVTPASHGASGRWRAGYR